jgi:hypothetical protein
MQPPSSLCNYGAASQRRQRPHIIRQFLAGIPQSLDLGLGRGIGNRANDQILMILREDKGMSWVKCPEKGMGTSVSGQAVRLGGPKPAK